MQPLLLPPPASLDLVLTLAGAITYVALGYEVGFVFLFKRLRFTLLDLMLLTLSLGCTFPWFVSTGSNGVQPFRLVLAISLIFFAWALGVKNCEWQRVEGGWSRISVIASTGLQLLLPLIALPSYYLLTGFAHYVFHGEHGMVGILAVLLGLLTIALLATFCLCVLLSIGTLYEVLMGVNDNRDQRRVTAVPAGND